MENSPYCEETGTKTAKIRKKKGVKGVKEVKTNVTLIESQNAIVLTPNSTCTVGTP